MRILVLGGTVFLSREVAAEALRRGHDVTCACRGESGTVPDGATLVHWDRDEPAPRDLTEHEYDAVVDVARLPSHVRRALAATSGAHWVFVSSVSAYADQSDPAGPGRGKLLDPIAEDLDPMSSPEAYGGMKVACEQLVVEGATSAVVVRPGLIVGPGDPTGRFTYWAARLARAAGGTEPDDSHVLAPGSPDDVVQVIDVRDLAAWIVTLAEHRTTGTFDAVGRPTRFEEVLHDCVQAAAPEAHLTWLDQALLTREGVEPWAGPDSIPLWLPRPEYDGMLAHDAQPAIDAGLVLRPVQETLADTQAWLRASADAPVTGITAEREQELLRRAAAPS